jgi:catechol 2,3-dioxygenase-like lactoylglutathione lyase family enzyme
VSHIRRFDHVGVTVVDLDAATQFFVALGLEIEGRTFVEGEFIDTVIGIPGSKSEIVMLRPPGGGTGVGDVPAIVACSVVSVGLRHPCDCQR